MLQNNLYYIVQNDQDGYTIRFDAFHPIFAGHFPGNPIVPGACMVQIAEELLALSQGCTVRFTMLHNLRFNQPITPDQEVRYILKKLNQAFIVQVLVDNVICAHFTIHYD